MALLKSANSTTIPWVDVQQPDLSVDPTGAAVPGPYILPNFYDVVG